MDNGIQVGAGFSYRSQEPLDSRFVVDTLTDLNNMPEVDIYPGLLVYVKSEKKHYIYDSDNKIWGIFTPIGNIVAEAGSNIGTTGVPTVTSRIQNGITTLTFDNLKGEQGLKGERGEGFNIVASFDNKTDMLANTTVLDGQMVTCKEEIVIDDTTQETTTIINLYTKDANATNGWTFISALSDMAAFKGDKGDQGEQGIQGIQGIKGDQGIPGPQGSIGPAGPKGDMGDPGVKGDQGIPGAQGPRGEQGPIGPTGPQGLSGPTGPKGDQGDPGPQGPLAVPDLKV